MSGRHRNNAFPRLCEMLFRIERGSNPINDLAAKCTIRLGIEELEATNGDTFEVSVTRAIAQFQGKGLEINPNKKFGEKIIQNTIAKETEELSKETSSSKSAGIDLNLQSAAASGNVKLGASGENLTSAKKTKSKTREYEEMTVVAKGGNEWVIENPDKTPLDGLYLDDTRLCDLVTQKGSNRNALFAFIYTKSRFLKIDKVEENGLKFTNPLRALASMTNRDRLRDIMIGKCLNKTVSNELGVDIGDAIVLSAQEVELEPLTD